MNDNLNPFLNAKIQLRNAFNLSTEMKNIEDKFELLSNPKRILEISIPVRMDNGKIRIFKWYRSQHNDARGPFKWWIRFHQDVSIDEVKALSIWMTLKTSVVDIPLWGWKWWIIVNPKELSIWELERLSRWYVRQLYKYIGPETDVPAPDVNTNWQIMAWMMDEYSTLVWKYSPGSFTWKPLSSGWSKWRASATAQGWFYVLNQILKLTNDELKWKTIIVQWAWNAWLTMAKLVCEAWAKLVWISDSSGWIYNKEWIFVDKIVELKESRKSVLDYSDAQKVTNEEILEMDCDILIPAALENQILETNASNIKARMILELANWPTTPPADEILEQKWILLIPDILANAWWVMVSYFEQVQNNMNFYWEEDEIIEKLERKMKHATNEVYHISVNSNTSLRKSAYLVAIQRVLSAMEDRGEV